MDFSLESDNLLSYQSNEQSSSMSSSPWENSTINSPIVETRTLITNDVRTPQQITYEHHQTVSTETTTQEVDTLFSVISDNQQQLHAPITVPMTPCITNTLDLKPNIQNIVATANLGCELNLKDIIKQARNAEYNPKRFAAVIMRIRNPRVTALIFGSGKIVCTGAKSEEDASRAARRFARIIQKLNFPVKFCDFKIQNMVGSVDVKFKIRLGAFHMAHIKFAHYEPEIFPGLIYQMKELKMTLLIFTSGKIVLTGAKIRENIYEAFEQIFPILRQFRQPEV